MPLPTHRDKTELRHKRRKRSYALKAKLVRAIDMMVFEGARYQDAAAAVGYTDRGLRDALARPEVRKAYDERLTALRTSERARNVHTLIEIRDGPKASAADNRNRLDAAKALDGQIESAEAKRPPGTVNVGILIGVDPRFADVVDARQAAGVTVIEASRPSKPE